VTTSEVEDPTVPVRSETSPGSANEVSPDQAADDVRTTADPDRRRHRAVTLVVVLATALQFAPRVWGQWGGWFYADDFWGQDLVVRTPLSGLLEMQAGGHVAPLSAILTAAFTKATLFSWTPHVVMTVVLWVIADVFCLLALRHLWGWGWPTGIAYAAFALSPLTAPSFLWLGQVWFGFLLVATTAALLLVTSRAVRVPSWRRVLVVVLVLVVSLALTERAALTAVFVGLFAVVAFAPSQGGVRRFLVRNRRLYLLATLVLVEYAMYYIAIVGKASDDPLTSVHPTVSGLGSLTLTGLGQSVGPGLLGGPWFLDASPVIARSDVPTLVVLAVVEVLVLIVFAALLARRAGWPALALLGVIVVVSVVLIAVARTATIGAYAMVEWRYYADLALWAPLLVTLALVPPGEQGVDPWPSAYPGRVSRAVRAYPVAWGLLGLVVVNGALATTFLTAERFRANPARPFLERTLADLHRLGPVTLIDRQLPPEVVPSILTTQTHASRVLSAATPTPTFDIPTHQLFAITDTGAVVPASVADGGIVEGGPDGACGNAVKPGTEIRLRLGKRLYDWVWWARVDYLAESDTVLTLDRLGQTTAVPLSQGPGVVFVPMSGPIDAVDLSVPAGMGGVCVSRLQVGNGVPAP